MRKNVKIFIVGIIVGVMIGTLIVYPGIFAWMHQINFFEAWYNIFTFLP